MRPLGCLGVGLSLVSGCLFLAVVAQLYYFFWWKKRKIDGDLFCWKKSSFSSSADLNPQEICVSVIGAIPSDEEQLDSNSTRDLLWKPFGEEDTVEAELMRLHRLAGPPRSLCTIAEETQQDLVSEDVRYRVGKSLRDLLLIAESPILTPLSSPPFFSSSPTPMACYSQNGFNPLFEPSDEDGLTWIWSSPPPKLKFLKDAEEKLYRKTLQEEELKDHSSSGSMKNKDIIEACAPSLSPVATSSPEGPEEQNGFFITTVTKTTPAIRRHQKDLYLPSPWSARLISMHVVDAAATAATVVANALRRKKRQSVVSESQNHGGRRSKSTQHSNSCSSDHKMNSEHKCGLHLVFTSLFKLAACPCLQPQ